MKRRSTPAKNEILAIFEKADTALSQDMVEQEMRGSVDRVTIYRILNSFFEDGVLHRVVSDDGKNYFALCTKCESDNHHHNHFHFRCLSCEKVECLKEDVHPKLPIGYKYENMNCWISGYCRTCVA